MTDDRSSAIRSALDAAYDKVEETEVSEATPVEREEPADEVVQAPERTADERARDEAGRFAKAEEKKRETLTLKGKTNAAKEQERRADNRGHNAGDPQVLAQGGKEAKAGGEANAQAAQQSAAAGNNPVQSQPILPPQHWNGRDKVEWERLPHHVKETLAAEYKAVNELRALAPVLEPLKERFTQEFGGTDRALGAILSHWQAARQRPLEWSRDYILGVSNGKPLDFLQHLAQSFGADPQSLFGSGSGTQQAAQPDQSVDPYIASLEQKLAAVEGQLQHIAQQPLIAQQNQIQAEVQSFGSAVGNDGKLAHPYFNDVKPVMAALMQSKQAKDLKEAYDMACYANPQIRAAMLAALQQGQAEERRRAAEQARGAAASVTGAPGHRGLGKPSNETAGQTLARVYEQLASGARA